ncbi:MAG TPA: protein phosphatase 2C domain-containing protein [Steroidobacteraceae bacterium]
MTAARNPAIRTSVGFYSAAGPRPNNQDFAGAVFGADLPEPRRDVVAALADGIGSAKGGRVAAETAVRGFLDGMCDLPESTEVQRAAARVLDALNAWMHAQGTRDPNLAGMGCTFTALVLRGRLAHVVHIGDSRVYRLRGDRLTQLTTDHVREGGADRSATLYRALGVESALRLEYTVLPMARHDRFLLCTDGLYGWATDETIADILSERSAPADTARALVRIAIDSGTRDNCTALVLDVLELPTAELSTLATATQLPIIPVPRGGETIDGFVLKSLLSDGRYARLFAATDEVEGGNVVLKFPKPQASEAAEQRAAFEREAWVGTRVHSPGLGRIIEQPHGRQSCLYTLMPLYVGELLETRLARPPAVGLEQGRDIAIRLAGAVATLHRDGIIHRDIKPDNVILEQDGALKLIDLGVVRIRGLEDSSPERIPGTQAYVAPEMFTGEPGNEATDIYALGVTMFRTYTGEFPYGNSDATSSPNRDRPLDLTVLRPDLPAWLQATLGRAIARDPAERFRDMGEFAAEMEAGPARTAMLARRSLTLYERYPLRFWQVLAVLLALALLTSVLRR